MTNRRLFGRWFATAASLLTLTACMADLLDARQGKVAVEVHWPKKGGYQVLTRSEVAGADIFTKQFQSHFIFFQGHPEYDALTLQREYMRDLARFLSGERPDYPAIPANYFDAATEARLAGFEKRAKGRREPTLAAELPGLTLRGDIAAGVAAQAMFRNWLSFLGRPPE